MRKISLFPRIVAAYDDNSIHGLYTCSVIFPKDKVAMSLKYILTLLNSHLINIWYKNYDTDIEIKLASVKNIPIANATQNQQMELSTLGDKITRIKQENHTANVSDLESQINRLVYQIYNLTEEEIKIVESC